MIEIGAIAIAFGALVILAGVLLYSLCKSEPQAAPPQVSDYDLELKTDPMEE